MRTAEEWLIENQGSLRGLKIFEKFRAEHDKEIIELIDKMISLLRKIQLDFEAQTSYFKNLDWWDAENQIKLLTELKNKIGELK